MKYCVTVIRTGCVFVEADNWEDALDIANYQLTDDIYWSDDWEATDAYEDDSEEDKVYVKEKAFD